MYDQGARITSPSFSVFYLRRDSNADQPRAGFTTPRPLGKAHDRNRIRRRMREAVRTELHKADPALDFVFHPRRAVLKIPLPFLRREVEKVLEQCKG